MQSIAKPALRKSLTRSQKFPRALSGLRAAGLIVTGGKDDGGNNRDEVSHKCGIDLLISLFTGAPI